MNELFKIAMTADVGGFVTGMAKADSATQRVGVGLQGLIGVGKGVGVVFNDISNLADQSLKKIRNVGIAGTTAALGWGVAAAGFETNMRNVNALLHLNSSAFAALEGSTLRSVSAFPQSITESTQGLYQIVSAGYAGKQASDLLSVSLKTASAGMSDTETAANSLIFALKAYGLSEKDVNDVSDILFQTVNKGILTFPQLAQGMGEWISMAATAKVPLQDAASALAAMTLSGIDPSEAATSLARVMQSFVKPTTSLTAEVHKLGYESPAAMLQVLGLHGSIVALGKDTGGTATAITTMFGDIRASKGVLALLNNDGKNYAGTQNAIADATARAGATQEAFNAQAGGASFKFHQMVNELQRLAIALGTPLLAPAKLFEGIVTNLAKGLGDLPQPIKQIIGLGTAVGGVFLALAGSMALWQVKSLITAGVAKFAVVPALTSMAAKAETAAAGGGILSGAYSKLSDGLLVTGVAAEKAGGSFFKFGFGASGILGRIPIINTGLSLMKSALLGISIAAGVAVIAFLGWQAVEAALGKADAAAKQFWSDFEGGLPTNNFQELSGALDSVEAKTLSLDKSWNDNRSLQGKASIWDKIKTSLGAAVDLTNLYDTGTLKQLRTAQMGGQQLNQYLDTYNKIQNIGTSTSQEVFAGLWDRGIQMNKSINLSRDQVLAFAEANDFQLINPQTHKVDQDQVDQMNKALTDYIATWGKLPDAAGKSLTAQAADIKAAAKYMKDYTDGVSKNFLDGFDVVKKFDNQFIEATNTSGKKKGQLKNQFGFDELNSFYSDALTRTNNFLSDYKKGIQEGIDPNFLARILAAGPNAAGDLLGTIVADGNEKFRQLVNFGESQLSRLAQAAVVQAKMIAIATQPTASAELTGELPKAQAIQAVLTAAPNISAADLAKMAGVTPEKLKQIGLDYAIPIPKLQVKTGSAKDLQNQVDKLTKGELGNLSLGVKLKVEKDQPLLDAELNKQPAGTQTINKSGTPTWVNDNGSSVEKQFSLTTPLKFDQADFEKKVKALVRSVDPSAPDHVIHILAVTEFKKQAIGALGAVGVEQARAETVVSLVGDHDAHLKLMKWQSDLKLTPAQLYTAMAVIGDKKGQEDVLNWIARVKGINVQNIVVSFDQNHKAHFYADAADAKKRVNEIRIDTPPIVNLKTGDFDTHYATVIGKIDKLTANPFKVALQMNGATAANSELDLLIQKLNQIGSTHFTVWAPSFPTPPAVKGPENGGIFKFADGGSMSMRTKSDPEHVAEVAPAGAWRLWAEPETGGEAYIPLANSKRARSERILKEVATTFGYQMVHKFDAGGIIRGVKSYEATATSVGASDQNTPSFAAAIAKAKADNPVTGTTAAERASSQKQQNQAVKDIISTMAHTYVDVAKAAGPQAAKALAASGLTGDSFSSAASKIIQQATDQPAQMDSRHQMGDIGDQQYETYLKKRLSKTQKFSSDWMDAWQKLHDMQNAKMKSKFDDGFVNVGDYENSLRRRLNGLRKYSAEWFTVYDELKSVKAQDASTRASIEDAQYQMGSRSADSYLKILQARQEALKKNTAEWWSLQQQIHDLKAGFSAPFTSATNIASAMSGQPTTLSGVMGFYKSTLGQSEQFLNNLQKLRAMKLNKTTLKEIQDAGPQDLSLTNAILSGGAKGVSFVNDAQRQINDLAKRAQAFATGKNIGHVTNIHLGGVTIKVGEGSTLTKTEIRREFDDAFKSAGKDLKADLEMGVK